MKNWMMLLTHMVFWGAGATIYMSGVKNAWEVALSCAMIACCSGLCYVARWRMRSRVWFFVSHILMATIGIACILIWELPVWYGVVLVALLLWSVMLQCAKAAAWLEEPTLVYAGVLAGVYLVLWRYQASSIAKTICAASIVLLYLFKQFYQNLKAVERYVDTRSYGTNADSVHAKNLCKQISTLFFGVFSFIVCLLGVTKIGGLGAMIQTWAYELWAKIAANFKLEPMDTQFMIGGMGGGNNTGAMLDELVGDQKPSPFAEFMSDVLLVGGEIVITIALIYGVIKLFVTIFRAFRKRELEREGNVFVEKLSIEAKSTKVRKKSVDEIKGVSAARQIRRIYKRGMKKHAREKIGGFSHMVPEEQVQCLDGHNYDAKTRTEIRQVYEKARYGADVVSNKDVESINSLL